MDNSIDKQFVEYIIKSLVGNPGAVKIERRIDEKGVLLELSVDPEDLGRVIGKGGATAQSIRTLLRALGTKNDARYNLKIIDNGPPREGYNRPPANNQSDDGPVTDKAAQSDSTAPPDNSNSSSQAQSGDDGTASTDTTDAAVMKDSINAPDNDTSVSIAAEPKSTDAWSSKPLNTTEDEDEKVEVPANDESVVSKTRKELEDLDDLDV